MKYINPPHPLSPEGPYLFLAGSIEMGTAEEWQKEVIEKLKDTTWTILNPRREEWNADLEQRMEVPEFKEQVMWELNGLEKCHIALFYFSPTTMSPISLLELGLVSQRKDPKDILVVCPEGFYRKGNIDIVCERYGITQYPDLTSACRALILLDVR